MTAINSVAILGAGTMGTGIAYVSCSAGLEVRLFDPSPSARDAGPAVIARTFDAGIARGKVTHPQKEEAMHRLAVSASLRNAVSGADLVIEAVPEAIALKKAIFTEVEQVALPGTVLATNTSSLSIAEIATAVQDPGRLIGMHFFNPVHAMRLVEIVRGPRTRDDVTATAAEFATRIGKTSIIVRDTPGFATSRLGVVLGLEAMRMLEQGVATAEDIDRAMALGYNHPVGPLRLTDLVGLDIRLAVADHLFRTLGGDTYRAPAILRRLVAEGKLGRKSGEGFFRWEAEG